MSDISRAYKDLTFPQLKSFCEAARLGSMTAAAASLEIAQPTVWKQIHALESHLGVTLLTPHARGCRVTPAGEQLLELVAPLVSEMSVLVHRFQALTGTTVQRLVVAATPRPCEEELPQCIADFERRFPKVRLVLRQLADHEIVPAVLSGEAELGICVQSSPVPTGLRCEKCYEFEPTLLMPHGHPLVDVKRIRFEDIARYPLLNARGSEPDHVVAASLDRVGAYDHPDRKVELHMARTIRRYVKLGFGIGIVGRPRFQPPASDIVERSLRSLIGYHQHISAIYRPRLTPNAALTGFIDELRRASRSSASRRRNGSSGGSR